MPIVVDEVIVSVEVTNETSGGVAVPGADAGSRQALIAECVEQVLEILSRRNER